MRTLIALALALLLALPLALVDRARAGKVTGREGPDGKGAQLDLPVELHQKNTGGSDGAGLCVFASMRHSGRWAGEPVFDGLFDWMKKHPGGGWPQKVDQMVAAYAAEKGLPKPDYIQVESVDLQLLKLACRTGRMPAVTYDHSPTGRYSGQRIMHMVSLVAADWGDGHWWVILDNNYPGTLEFLTEAEFRSVHPTWAVIPLAAGPPPVPVPKRGVP